MAVLPGRTGEGGKSYREIFPARFRRLPREAPAVSGRMASVTRRVFAGRAERSGDRSPARPVLRGATFQCLALMNSPSSRLRLRLLALCGACLLTASAGLAADRAALEADKKKLMQQIGLLQDLIDAMASPADPDRVRDEKRRDERMKELGKIEIALSKLPPAVDPTQDLSDEKRRAERSRAAKVTEVDALKRKITELDGKTDDASMAQLQAAQDALPGKKTEQSIADVSLTAAQKKLAAAKLGASTETRKDSEIADVTESVVKAALDSQLNNTFLRKHGFAVNMGYGYVGKLRAYAPDIQIRYNFLNGLHVEDVKADRVAGKKRSLASKWADNTLFTDISGWIGYPLQKFENRARTVGAKTYAAGEVKEAPIVAGLALGLGNGFEFSSAISLNVGVAVFNHPAFKHTSAYYGVSVDAVLFKGILKALADSTGK